MPVEPLKVFAGAEPLPLSDRSSGIQQRMHRSHRLLRFSASILWALAANLLATRAARGLAVRFQWSDGFLLLDAVFLVFLLVVGFAGLKSVSDDKLSLRMALGFPRRATSRAEWATGTAIGWATVLLTILPVVIAGDLYVKFWPESRPLGLALLNMLTVSLLSMAAMMVFQGYPFQRLIDAVGPGWATLVMSLLFAAAMTYRQDSTYLSTLIAVALGVVLCLAWLRTHGLWLGWGVYFAWQAGLGILFGLPVSQIDNLSSVVETRAIGARWLTGGDLGPEGSLPALILIFAAIVVVVRVSRDWEWEYTRKPLIPAGYPMDVPPPAQHVEMEKIASAPALVQILPTTPQTRSVERDERN